MNWTNSERVEKKTGWKCGNDFNMSKSFGPIEARATLVRSDGMPSHWYCYLSVGNEEITVSYSEVGITDVFGEKTEGDYEILFCKALERKIKTIIKSWAS